MAGEGDVGAVVVGEDVVEELGEAGLLRGAGFAEVGFPEGVELGEVGLEGVCWEGFVDEGFAAAAVAGVDSDGFAEELVFVRMWKKGKIVLVSGLDLPLLLRG